MYQKYENAALEASPVLSTELVFDGGPLLVSALAVETPDIDPSELSFDAAVVSVADPSNDPLPESLPAEEHPRGSAMATSSERLPIWPI